MNLSVLKRLRHARNYARMYTIKKIEQIQYLAATPVRGLAALLSSGLCKLSFGIERCLGDLGALRTELGTLGDLQSVKLTREPKFRLRDVVPLLRANRGSAEEMLRAIERWIETDIRGEIRYNSTVMIEDGEPVLKDGNHRTLAFFERRRNTETAIAFEMFVVEISK